MMSSFTQYVGVAPATTTMQLGGLGVCPPCYFGPPSRARFVATPAAGSQTVTTVNPYATESQLSGLGSTSRWPLFALMLGLGFAGALGVAAYKRR